MRLAVCHAPASVTPLPRSEPDALLTALGELRLLVVSGKGGVGRTTTAALLGSALAARGRRVLIATTGHDDRLAWMLGGETLSDKPVAVAERLEIQRLVPATCVEEYGALITRSARLSNAVFGNRVVRRLLRAIPGLDDFAVLGKVWHEAVRARSHDVILFDGPASGHLRLVLGVPQAIVDTVAEGPLTREAFAMRDALQDPDVCAAVLVGLPEPWPLTELGELATALREDIGMHVGARVVNKLAPRLPAALGERSRGERSPGIAALLEVVDELDARGREQRRTVAEWLAAADREDEGALVPVPWWPWGLESPQRLSELRAAVEAGVDAAGGPLHA